MQVLPKNLTEFLIRTHFKNHQLISMLVLMRTSLQFFQKLPGKVAVLLRTAARFSQKYFFKNHPSGDPDPDALPPTIVSESRTAKWYKSARRPIDEAERSFSWGQKIIPRLFPLSGRSGRLRRTEMCWGQWPNRTCRHGKFLRSFSLTLVTNQTRNM